MKNGKINSLNVLGIRRVPFPARHFSYTELSKFSPVHSHKVTEWIEEKLNGRYYVGMSIGISSDNVIVYTTLVGFENSKELSFFNLACSELI